LKELKKLGHQARRDVMAYFDERVAGNANPQRFNSCLSNEAERRAQAAV